MATLTGKNSFLQRLIGALALDVAIYEEVEGDRGATTQAFAVVVLSSLAAGIGARGFAENTRRQHRVHQHHLAARLGGLGPC